MQAASAGIALMLPSPLPVPLHIPVAQVSYRAPYPFWHRNNIPPSLYPLTPGRPQLLHPPGMQLTAVLPHDLFLCINSNRKCKQPLQMQACCTYQVCDGGLARGQLGPGWGPWWWGWWGAAGGQWCARASWGRGACNRDGASAAHQHTDTAPRS